MEARNEKALLALFAPDATWTAAGGGRTPAAPRPIVGAERIVKLVLGLQAQFYRSKATLHFALVNGETGLCLRVDGRLMGVLAVESDGDRILAVYAVVNPEKLGVGQSVGWYPVSHTVTRIRLRYREVETHMNMKQRVDATNYVGSGAARAMLSLQRKSSRAGLSDCWSSLSRSGRVK